MEKILNEKNLKLVELQLSKSHGASSRKIEKLASRVAALETSVAEKLIDIRRPEAAVINLVSAASALIDAQRHSEAARLLRRARRMTSVNVTATWIDHELKRLNIKGFPADTFSETVANILDNANLRIPQREARLAAMHHFKNSLEHAVIQLPVGSGKLGTMAVLPFGLAQGRSLIVASNEEISRRLSLSLDHSSPQSFFRKTGVLLNVIGPKCAVMAEKANVTDADASDFVVTTMQHLGSRSSSGWLDRLTSDYFDLVLVDENLQNVGRRWQRVFEQFPRAKVVRFVSSPLRISGKDLSGRMIYRFPISDAILEGYVRDLSSMPLKPKSLRFECQGSSRRLSLSEVLQLEEKEWFTRGIAMVRECDVSIVNASIQSVETLRKNGKARHHIIATACSVDHAIRIKSLYREQNYAAEVIHNELRLEELDSIRRDLKNGLLDVVVDARPLGEGAEYDNLGVAAIFRPYRQLPAYLRFVGRIMHVVNENSPRDPDNRGYVVSHVGLNGEEWWEELSNLDPDDQILFEQIANGERTFLNRLSDQAAPTQVLDSVIERFAEVVFLEADPIALVDDILHAVKMRGVDLEVLNVTRTEVGNRLVARHKQQHRGPLGVRIHNQRGSRIDPTELKDPAPSTGIDEDEIRRRVHEEVDSLSSAQLRSFRVSRDSMNSWIYKVAQKIGRILSAPFRWVAAFISGFLEGYFRGI
jgi:DNA repair protein RadD